MKLRKGFLYGACLGFGGLFLTPNVEATLEKKIEYDLQHEKYDHLGCLLKQTAGRKIGLQAIKKIAQKNNAKPLLHAVNATQNINLKKTNLGISSGEFLQSALFFETHADKTKGYLKKNKTGLAHTVEIDPKLKSCFVVADGKKAYLGKGKKKIVTRAIFYDKKHPRVVARAEQAGSCPRETKITKKVHGSHGIFKTMGFGAHKNHGKSYNTIYSRLYKPGSLETFFEKRYKLSLYEKMKVASDILCGLETLHEQKIVHRDLGARNYLIHLPHGKPGKRNVEACIADLGRADYVKNVKDSKIQGNTTYTAPEGLYRSKLARKDYFQTDVFATGCVFYRLLYGKKTPWQLVHYVKDTHRSVKLRYNEMTRQIRRATWHRRHQLSQKSHLSPKEDFEHLILQMLHVEPRKRGSAKVLRQKMQKIFARVGGKVSAK